jgi:hypothetical protein
MRATSSVYVAIDEYSIPIASSNILEELINAVDYYHGAHINFQNRSSRVSWDTDSYSDDSILYNQYEGKLTYDCSQSSSEGERKIFSIKIYKVDHFIYKENTDPNKNNAISLSDDLPF